MSQDEIVQKVLMEIDEERKDTLLVISNEILGHIFTFLPWFPDFVRISEICKRFHYIIRESPHCNHGFNGGWKKLSIQVKKTNYSNIKTNQGFYLGNRNSYIFGNCF
jgi:hypothetical protein